MLPFFLDLKDKPVLLVGGGSTALKRGKKLLAAGAKLTAYAENFTEEFFALDMELKQETFENQSMEGFWLVIAATDDEKANGAIARRAKEARIFCNHVSDGKSSDLVFPLHLRRSGYDIAITDSYCLPFLLKGLSQTVEDALPDFSPADLEKLSEIRTRILRQYPGEKEILLKKLATMALDNQDLEEEPDEIIRRLQRE